MTLPTTLDYPIVAVGDLHGRADWLAGLVARLERLPEWPAAKFVFLGDLGDRCDAVKDAVTGNHDLALVRATGLDGRPPSPYWVERYGKDYDHAFTFRSYLGRPPRARSGPAWVEDLAALKEAMPAEHRELFAAMPWVAEASGHLFLHCGLSPDLDCPPSVQVECLRRKVWSRDAVQPRLGTRSDELFTPDYPVWLGADRRLSKAPLPYPGKVQVTGHAYTRSPEVNAARIRLDTSGGTTEPLTACLLRGPTDPPEFIRSDE
jgi:serine/threonine protein phosphatase 1